MRAHARAGGILARTLDLPGTGRVSRSLERVEDGDLGAWRTTIVRPSTSPPWPSVLFANGATPDGRAHPAVRRLGIALARSGYLVFIPDLPGIAAGELSPRTLGAAVDCATRAADSTETERGRVGLVGVSVGGTLALLAAADRDLAPRISVVACIAPFTDLENVMMLATTGTYPAPGGPEPYAVPPSLPVGLARSLIAILPPTADARALRRLVDRLDPTSADPLSGLRELPCRSLGPAAGAAQELLVNRDPGRFPGLYAALPAAVRQTAVSLSPLRCAAKLLAPIEIATAPRDRYFPVAESLALASEARDARVTVTAALAHAVPTMSLRSIGGIARLHGFFVRSLAAANSCVDDGADEQVRWR
jgi:dienelactone hydrolase